MSTGICAYWCNILKTCEFPLLQHRRDSVSKIQLFVLQFCALCLSCSCIFLVPNMINTAAVIILSKSQKITNHMMKILQQFVCLNIINWSHMQITAIIGWQKISCQWPISCKSIMIKSRTKYQDRFNMG